MHRALPDARRYECRTDGCPNQGRTAEVHPRPVHTGDRPDDRRPARDDLPLYEWPAVRCAGCHVEPWLLDA
jgi:hypothetical protein